MIISAEAGTAPGDTGVIYAIARKQLLFVVLDIICIFVFINWRVLKYPKAFFTSIYYLLTIVLLSTRVFGAAGGAYAWIRFGGFTIQPSEFAKVFSIVYAAKLFSINNPKENLQKFKNYIISMGVWVAIILLWQKDLGSAAVLLAISYIVLLIPPYKELKKYQNWMVIGILMVLIIACFLLSPIGTKLLENFSSHYQIARFLSSADPFRYMYTIGYHLVMSLVSFGNGGLFGLGYNQSIHKNMNFPNPSTDFILPVIIEEMGIVFGLIPILVFYGMIIFPLLKHSLKTTYLTPKIVCVGVFMYFALHFVLNVGGVSGLIPLTGVPLLFLSYGGSSSLAVAISLGIAECEIIKYKRDAANENNSREV